ncbi:hypothetical protein RIF29_09246 [Crotalaria pallida]|uniref:Ku domain-containing protein n=1 Tax=Crotalaria pallida TaxID=3830 RepID=A0AAN9IJD3_CROPI
MKKDFDKAPPSDKSATHEVKVDYEYKSSEDNDKVIPPDQRIKEAMLAVFALARAMKEKKKVAILCGAWRHGQGNVLDSFYFNVLPIAEDVREIKFPSFTNSFLLSLISLFHFSQMNNS